MAAAQKTRTGRTGTAGWSGTGWTSLDDVRTTLRRRWSDGSLLRALADAGEFEPLAVPLKGPSARELGERLVEAQGWVNHLEDGRRRSTVRTEDPGLYELEWRSVGGQLLGANDLPRRVHIRDPDQLWRLLGVREEVAAFQRVLAEARASDPAIAGWVRDHPHKALALRAQWPRLLLCVDWIRAHSGRQLYLRQLDIHGVDTKFIEQHRVELGALLDLVLPPERIDTSRSVREFDARYGFRTRPEFVRTRMLDGSCWVSDGVSDCYLRIEEAARRRPPAERVIIVENEISYLALPPLPGVLGVFGKGFDVARLAGLPWLHELPVTYWGDIDTHGFVILDRLRAHLPAARSMLMDVDTLLRHRELCGTEPKSARGRIARLTGLELAAYDYLIDNAVDGLALRLEQERIDYASVCQALGVAST